MLKMKESKYDNGWMRVFTVQTDLRKTNVAKTITTRTTKNKTQPNESQAHTYMPTDHFQNMNTNVRET